MTAFLSSIDIVPELSFSCALGFLGVLLRYRLMYSMREELPNPNASQEDMIQDLFRMQSFLLPNILGCFVMGILVAWAKDHKLFGGRTVFRDIHVGLTTGFCGCLTTFSSWMTGFNDSIFRRYWFLDLLLVVVEMCLVWSFFCFGQHCYIILKDVRAELVFDLDSRRNGVPNSFQQGGDSDVELSQHTSREQICPHLVSDESHIGSSPETIGDPEQIEWSPSHEYTYHQDDAPSIIASEPTESHFARTETPSGPVSTAMVERTAAESKFCHLLGSLVVISLVILWVIVLVDVRHRIVSSIYMRDALRSVAFSPFGVSLRYMLKKWETHTRKPAQWSWFPWSTFLCNICGSCVAAGIVCYASNWGWSSSFVTGFLGSLTTVSSLMKELEELHYSHGKLGPVCSTIYTVATFGITIMFEQFIRLHRH